VILSRKTILPAAAVRSYLVLRKIIGCCYSSENLHLSEEKAKVSNASVKDDTGSKALLSSMKKMSEVEKQPFAVQVVRGRDE
jgi:hypothetical protein